MEKPKRTVWQRLDLPVKVAVGVVTIVAAAVGGAIAVNREWFASSAPDRDPTVVILRDRDSTEPAAVAAERIQACMRRHAMPAPRVQVQPRRRLVFPTGFRILFRRCDWPPIADTSADGYSEITYATHEYLAAAERFGEVDTIEAPCDEIVLTFAFLHMGQRQFASARISPARLLGATTVNRGGKPAIALLTLDRVPQELFKWVPLPSPDHFVVLRNGHVDPFDARCHG